MDIKAELRKQGNVKITGFSPNQMKKKLAKINKAGTIPPPPPTRPGEEEIVPPPPPFKPPCNSKCCDKVGKSNGVPTVGSSSDAIPGVSANQLIAMVEEEPAPVEICMQCGKPSEYMVCDTCTKKGNGISLFGDQYIGEGAPEREPVLTEFS